MRYCVFAGSSPGARTEFSAAAEALGHELAARQIGLVYGGAKVGLMGVVADAVLARGGEVIGVIPSGLAKKEVAHDGLTELHVVESLHVRKAMMEELSDGTITLPGGLGTFEETLEILTWGQLGIHTKPCGLLNPCGYYDDLLKLLDRSVAERFMKPAHRELLLVSDCSAELLDRMSVNERPRIDKWLDRREQS